MYMTQNTMFHLFEYVQISFILLIRQFLYEFIKIEFHIEFVQKLGMTNWRLPKGK